MISTIASHVWQSTLFAGAAALLTLAFRANQARVRYWIWLTASLKFLLPFAPLTSLGGHIHIGAPIAAPPPAFSYAVEYFSRPVLPRVAAAVAASSRPALSDLAIPGVWGCGVICLALLRLRGWRRIRRILRASGSTNLPFPVEVRWSPVLMEPAVVGFIRPVLLLPQGITERLTASEMNAILAHELCHVRRRDNPLALLHMVVETMFWFHPLVWWIGARLLEERERACDEDVVSQGNAPEVYAEAILNVCRQFGEPPLACVSGVTGANLKRRIEAIMTSPVGEKLNRGRKVLLIAAGVAALAIPLVEGSLEPRLSAQSPDAARPKFEVASFEVASIKPCVRQLIPDDDPGRGGGGASSLFGDPGMFRTPCMPVRWMIQMAYVGFAKAQMENPIQGGPDWTNSERFIIVAKPDTPQPRSTMAGPMLQALLEDRFKLKVHRENKKVSAYELVVARGGSKLQATPEGGCTPPDAGALTAPVVQGRPLPCHYGAPDMNGTKLVGATMDSLCQIISGMVRRDVIDKTGLTGLFDAILEFDVPPPGALANDPDLAAEAFATTTAALRKLGLELKSTRGDAEFVVIDHIERPTAN